MVHKVNTGRIFEYFVVKQFQSSNPTCSLDAETLRMQDRDRRQLHSIDPDELKRLECASLTLLDWVSMRIDVRDVKRMPDSAGRIGDATDVVVVGSSDVLRLSLKSNHDAAKHQRPMSLMQQLGFDKKSVEDLDYRSQYRIVINRFNEELKLTVPIPTEFRHLKEDVIKRLYSEVCRKVSTTINNYRAVPSAVKHYQRFLFGKNDCVKVVKSQTSLTIKDYGSLVPAREMFAKQENASHIDLFFDGHMHFRMRLHTAASKITGNPSLKFDTTLVNAPILSIVVPY